MPTFATEPDISADTTTVSCADSALNTNDGPANIEINWEPNEIEVRWYNGNTLMTSNTCTYDGALTMPSTIPTRTGYTFKGWRVRPQMDFTTIVYNGNDRFGYSIDEPNSNSPYYPQNNCMTERGAYSRSWANCNDNIFQELQLYEWKAGQNNYFYGASKISAKIGNNNCDEWDNDSSNWKATYDELQGASGTEKYCWCQLTGYKPSGSSVSYRPTNILPWIYVATTNVNITCSMWCAAKFTMYLNFRQALLGKLQ